MDSTEPMKKLAPHTKLDEFDVRDIRARVAQGESRRAVALEYRISTSTVSNIVRRDTFWWVEESMLEAELAQGRQGGTTAQATREQLQREHKEHEDAEALAFTERVQRRVEQIKGGGK